LDQSLLTIFGARDHPFAFAVESDASDIASMTFEREDSSRICRSDIVKLHSVVAGGCQKALIW
jgi:hypothetical protein